MNNELIEYAKKYEEITKKNNTVFNHDLDKGIKLEINDEESADEIKNIIQDFGGIRINFSNKGREQKQKEELSEKYKTALSERGSLPKFSGFLPIWTLKHSMKKSSNWLLMEMLIWMRRGSCKNLRTEKCFVEVAEL